MDFKNTIIILTSNLGSQAILDGITPEGEISEAAKNEVQTLLRRNFRPEFLNRLDEIVFYKPLSKENITGIMICRSRRLISALPTSSSSAS